MQLQATILLMMSVIMPNMLMAEQDECVVDSHGRASTTEWHYFHSGPLDNVGVPIFNVASVQDLTPAQRKFADNYLGAGFHFNFDGPWRAEEGIIPGMTPFVVEGKTYPGENLTKHFIPDTQIAQWFDGKHISKYHCGPTYDNKNLWEARSEKDLNDFTSSRSYIRIRVNDSADGIDVMFTKGDSRGLLETSYRSRVNEYHNTERGWTAVGAGLGQEAEWIPMQNWKGFWAVDGDKANGDGVCSVLHLGNNVSHPTNDSFHNIFGTYVFSIDHIYFTDSPTGF